MTLRTFAAVVLCAALYLLALYDPVWSAPKCEPKTNQQECV